MNEAFARPALQQAVIDALARSLNAPRLAIGVRQATGVHANKMGYA